VTPPSPWRKLQRLTEEVLAAMVGPYVQPLGGPLPTLPLPPEGSEDPSDRTVHIERPRRKRKRFRKRA